MRARWVISCEHGGNEIPPAYAHLFGGAQEVLRSHRGWDPGALPLFEQLQPLADFAKASTTSRLLIELNRSLHHPELFSAYTRSLAQATREEIIRDYYLPYRQAIEKAIAGYVLKGETVYHLGIHSFTPVLNGEVRNADIGLLYDPERALEEDVCQQWQLFLQEAFPDFSIRFNYPYLGIDDGFTTHLRQQHPQKYAGIELELNQQWAHDQEVHQKLVQTVQALQQALRK
jgi:predicted N-formylglutamate amidohydrolase